MSFFYGTSICFVIFRTKYKTISCCIEDKFVFEELSSSKNFVFDLLPFEKSKFLITCFLLSKNTDKTYVKIFDLIEVYLDQ